MARSDLVDAQACRGCLEETARGTPRARGAGRGTAGRRTHSFPPGIGDESGGAMGPGVSEWPHLRVLVPGQALDLTAVNEAAGRRVPTRTSGSDDLVDATGSATE